MTSLIFSSVLEIYHSSASFIITSHLGLGGRFWYDLMDRKTNIPLMAESAKRRSCFQSLNLDGEGFPWQPFWWLRCNYLQRSTNSGYPHDLDQVLRHRGGVALLKAKMRFYDFKRRLGDKGSEVRIFILSNMESMTMLMSIPMMIIWCWLLRR